MLIRSATLEDIPAMCAIENYEVEQGYANFGLERVTVEAQSKAFQDFAHRYPWIVAEHDGIVGYAKASPWKTRGAYAWTCEIGVYVSPEQQGKGIGRLLYQQLFPAIEAAGFRTIIAGIALPNPASVRLHEAFGMKPVGVFEKNGYKFDQWWDVGYWSLHLDAGLSSE